MTNKLVYKLVFLLLLIDVHINVRYNVRRGDIMNYVNITNARKDLYNMVKEVSAGYEPTTIINNKGKNVVMISEDEWNGIQETLYLKSIPGYGEQLLRIAEEEDWEYAEKYDPDKEW